MSFSLFQSWFYRGGVLLLLSFSPTVFSASLYLSLQDPLMPWVERLGAVSGLSSLKKPYSLQSIRDANQTIESTYPALFQHIESELKNRYGHSGVNRVSVSAQLANEGHGSNDFLPNQYGTKRQNALAGNLVASWQSNEYLKAMVDVTGRVSQDETGLIANNAYLSMGFDWLQLDVGYRDHWFSANSFNGVLKSHNAKNAPSLTLSNQEAYTPLGIRFEAFLSRLDSHHGIKLNNTSSDGNPYLSGIQLQFQPVDEWGMSLNRTFMFGGGDRKVTFGDFVQAFINPTGKDNVGLGDCTGFSPNCEFGNQQMAIESQLKLNVNTFPIVVNASLAAEDTERGSAEYLGNTMMSFGITMPYLTRNQSLSFQLSDWEAGWYTHHIYPEGYTNSGSVMGAYWASMQQDYQGSPGNELAMQWEYFAESGVLTSFEYRLLTTMPLINGQKQIKNGHFLQGGVKQIPFSGGRFLLNTDIVLGQSVHNKFFAGIEVGVEF